MIGCLVEGFKDGARFAAACAEAARKGKPVVGLKVGRSEYGAKAAASHTASITGSAEVNSTVFQQLGVVEVDDLDELVDVAMLFCRKIPTGHEQIGVFASSGGAASLCADNVGMAGLTLAEFTPETAKRLADALPAYANMSNPIDTTSISISHPDAYREALAACAADANVGLVLAPLPMDYGEYSVVNAGSLKAVQDGASVPIVPIWMSERQGGGYRTLAEAGLVPFRSLRNMRKALRRWIDYGAWAQARDADWRPAIVETGSLGEAEATRTLSEIEGKQALAAAGVPATAPEIAETAEQAARIAAGMGGRLAFKIVSPEIIHKSDIGGVMLDVTPETAAEAHAQIMENARAARPDATLAGVLIEPMAEAGGIEAFVGISRDPVFGQVMTFGLGGIYVEMFADVTRAMLPVTREMAKGMIGALKSSRLLTGYRGQPARDTAALADLIVKVSDYAVATPELIEMDINPVWVGTEGQGVLALDAVIVVEA